MAFGGVPNRGLRDGAGAISGSMSVVRGGQELCLRFDGTGVGVGSGVVLDGEGM